MLIINNNIRHDQFALPNMDRLEAVAACIYTYLHNNEQLLFVSTYLPPAAPVVRTDLDKIFFCIHFRRTSRRSQQQTRRVKFFFRRLQW